MDHDPAPAPDPLDDSHVSVVAPGLVGLLGAIRRIRITGGVVDLTPLGGPRVPVAAVRHVEFRRDRRRAAPGYLVELATLEGSVPVLDTPNRVLARALAERVARRLRRDLRDLAGDQVRIRRAAELDTPVDLAAPPAGVPEPRWGLRIQAGPGVLHLEWAHPARAAAAALGVVALAALGTGFPVAALGAAALALGAMRRTTRLALVGGVLGLGRGLGPLRRWQRLPAAELEQVEVEEGEPSHLLLVSDAAVLEVERPRDQLEWVRRRLLEALRDWRKAAREGD